MDRRMDGWTAECNSKQTREEIIAPEGTHALKGITLCLPWIFGCSVSLHSKPAGLS